jgi:hypothetical protein
MWFQPFLVENKRNIIVRNYAISTIYPPQHTGIKKDHPKDGLFERGKISGVNP